MNCEELHSYREPSGPAKDKVIQVAGFVWSRSHGFGRGVRG